MKKAIAVLLLLSLLLSGTAALAKGVSSTVVRAFSDTWVSTDDSGTAVEIWYKNGAFHCSATRHIDVDRGYTLEYRKCRYSSKTGRLTCTGGVATREVRNKKTGKLESMVVRRNITSTFALDKQRHLTWTVVKGKKIRIPLLPLDEFESKYGEH